jgi:hypothetical protein
MTKPKAAPFPDGEPCPPFWERMVLAAYFRALGSSQPEAARAVGRSTRTIKTWEADRTLWVRAVAEARLRWLGEATALARRQLLAGLRNDEGGELSLKLLERLDPELAPPAHRLKHEGTIALTDTPEWQRLRTQILTVLADLPEARLRLAEVLSGETAPLEERRNGSSNGFGH